ncbi:MAG: exosortase-associated EpsI family protein [Thermoguttaceae bacterium]|nr:exosortase-associated EpsI family protein [Thermoguttaceae bacterium]
MQYKIYLPAAIGLILIGALYVSTNMLGFSQQYMDYLIKIVQETPEKFGNWIGNDNAQANEAITKESGALAQVSRVYENQLFGETINLYFISGISFRVAMHSPIVCYPGSGYEQQGEVQTFDFDYVYTDSKTGKNYARKATFFTVVFKKEDHSERVFWSWNDGSGWVAPQFARLHFGGHIPLCKCYFSYVDNSPSVYDFDKKYITDFATRFLSDVDNRMIVDGKVPSEAIKINLGEEINDSQIKQEAPTQIESDISPSVLPTNDNFDSLIKESETLNE